MCLFIRKRKIRRMIKIARDIMSIHRNIIPNIEELTYIFTSKDIDEPSFKSNKNFYMSKFKKERSLCHFYYFFSVDNRVKFIDYFAKKHKFTIGYANYLLTCSHLINKYFTDVVSEYYEFIGHVDYDKQTGEKIIGCNCNKVFNRHLYEANLLNVRIPAPNLVRVYEYIKNNSH